MREFEGFQTMEIQVPYGITFDTVGVFGLAFHLLFKSCYTYCETSSIPAFENRKNLAICSI